MSALVEILGDSRSFSRAARESAVVADKLAGGLDALAVTAERSANAQIKASLKKDAQLRGEIETYRAVAAAAERGSREEIVASNLAARAQQRLARSMGVTAEESLAFGHASSKAEREVSRAARGALAGSGLFTRFGRSLAFASGGFLAFASGGQIIRNSVDAAREAEVTQRQLGRQLRASGLSYRVYRGEIDRTDLSLSALSGFTKQDLDQSFTTIFRTTKNVTTSLRDNALAADLARARHISLAQAGLIVAKTEAGNTTLLRRQGFEIAKNASASQALAVVRRSVAGQARAGATEEQRFGATLHNTEVIFGQAVIPTLNEYLASGAKYLQNLNTSGRLQKDVAHTAHAVSEGVHDVVAIVRTADHVTGSFTKTLELLLALRVAGKLSGWATDIGLIGNNASTAAGEVATLRGKLGKIAALPAIIITIDIVENFIPRKATKGGQKILNSEGVGVLGKIPLLGPALQAGAFYGRQTGKALGINYGDSGGIKVPSQYSRSDLAQAYTAGYTGDAAPFSLGAMGSGPLLEAYLAGRRAGRFPVKSATAAGKSGSITSARPRPRLDRASRIGNEVSSAQLAVARNEKGAQQRLVAALKDQIDFDRKYERIQEDLIKRGVGDQKKHAQILDRLRSDEAQALDQISSIDETAAKKREDAAKKRESAAKKAHDRIVKEAKHRADLARRAAAQERQALKQALDSAKGVLGDLGQGPVATGPEASFLQQYGGHLTASAYSQDLAAQNKQSSAFLRNLNRIRRRGGSSSLVQTLLGQGQGGMAEASALASASKRDFASFLNNYKTRQQLLTRVARMEVHAPTVTITAREVNVGKTDARDRPTANKFTRVGSSGRRRT